MDGSRFDVLTRMLVDGGRSRRAMLKMLWSGGAGAVAISLGGDVDGATCRNPRQSCRTNASCCNEICEDGQCRCIQLQGSCEKAQHCCNRAAICSAAGSRDCGLDPGHCCLPPGQQTCLSDCDCCGSVGCHDGTCCNPAGAACEGGDCCGDAVCVDGICCHLPNTFAFGVCATSAECCFGVECSEISGRCCNHPGDYCEEHDWCCQFQGHIPKNKGGVADYTCHQDSNICWSPLGP